jgi:hypothetical protein
VNESRVDKIRAAKGQILEVLDAPDCPLIATERGRLVYAVDLLDEALRPVMTNVFTYGREPESGVRFIPVIMEPRC